jgi:ABC-type nitrate/sulfonate/bicarbonate transport system substrate-binding protein
VIEKESPSLPNRRSPSWHLNISLADITPMGVIVALDWTPNTNHTGFFVAKSKGYYREAGLEVSFVSPGQSEHKTPAERVRDGSATFAIAPSETVISSHTQASKPPLQVTMTAPWLRKICLLGHQSCK